MSSLAGKVVVIIGGTTGIGCAATTACLEAGARVVVVGSEAAEVGAARVLAADARDPATAPRAIAEAVREFRGFDALYHVAGGSGRKWGDGPVHELSDEGWAKTIEAIPAAINNTCCAVARNSVRLCRPGLRSATAT